MDMTPSDGGDSGGGNGGDFNRYEIVLISLNERFWLLKGDAHLKVLLSGQGEFPTPVGCLVFENHAKFAKFAPEGADLGDLWMINPLIVGRLRENKQIVDLHPDV